MKNQTFICGMVMALFAITTLNVEGRDDLPESDRNHVDLWPHKSFNLIFLIF